LSRANLEWDFAAYLWTPVARANDNDASAPMARYFVIHDTSGPYFGSRAFPPDIDVSVKINSLKNYRCIDGGGAAHVVVNRTGGMLLNHELSIPWRETKFEQGAPFHGALKGLFLHVELIQPRRGRFNDAEGPTPGFTPAQYDRLALIYTIASVRAGRWLIPAFHAALDADIPNGHDDPMNFDAESFARSIQHLADTLSGGVETAAAPPVAPPPVPWGIIDTTPEPDSTVTAEPNPATMPNLGTAEAAQGAPETKADGQPAAASKSEPRDDAKSEPTREHRTVSAEHCQTRFVKGYRRRVCWTVAAESRGRGARTRFVRAVDRRFSRQGAGAWHHAGNLRLRHGYGKARYGRA